MVPTVWNRRNPTERGFASIWEKLEVPLMAIADCTGAAYASLLRGGLSERERNLAATSGIASEQGDCARANLRSLTHLRVRLASLHELQLVWERAASQWA